MGVGRPTVKDKQRRWPTPEIIESGTFEFDAYPNSIAFGGSAVEQVVTHNLGYPPRVVAHVDIGTRAGSGTPWYSRIPVHYEGGFSAGDPRVGLQVEMFITSSDITFRLTPWAVSYTGTTPVKYYILSERLDK